MYLISGIILMALVFRIWLFSNAFLSIRVSPRDAIVTVDGEEILVNEFGIGKKRSSLGSHLITVEADGYVSFIKTIKFKRGITTGVKASLLEIPEPSLISEGGKFITKGNDSNEFFYLGNNDSTIYRAKIEVNDEKEIIANSYAVTKPELYDIEDIIWSPKKDLALFRKSDGVYMFDFHKYDFVNQTETLFGNDIGSIAWSPDNSKIAYSYEPGDGERSIIFSGLDNTNMQRIVNLTDYGITNPILRWSPDSEWLLVIPQNDERSSNKIYLLNTYSREFKVITEDGNKLDAMFTPDNNQILFSSYNRGYIPVIGIMNRDGTNDFIYDLNAEIKNIYFLGNPNEIMVASTDEYGSSIFKFDLALNRKKDFAVNFLSDLGLSAVTTNRDDKAIIYNSDEGIFGMPTERLVSSNQ